MSDSQAPAVVRLRVPEFRERAERVGLTSDDEIADHLGVNRSTVWRVLREQQAPGNVFIACVLQRLPRVKFPDVFEIVTPANERKDRAA
jgi:hypothetical protein